MNSPFEESRSVTNKVEAPIGLKVGYELGESTTRRRRGLEQVVKNIANSEFVILLDDFHYMPREVQAEVAKALKEGVRLGLKICTAAVLHRADDVLRANPELRGRVRTLDITYWKREDLNKIAVEGYGNLHVALDDNTISRFSWEAAGSPQIMQLICLQAV